MSDQSSNAPTSNKIPTSPSNSSSSDDPANDDSPLDEETPQLDPSRSNNGASKDKSLHVSVRRAKISATTAREGESEMEQLDVEVYDQGAYEAGIFEQVNEALSAVDRASAQRQRTNEKTQDQSSGIDDLMRVIHNQGEKGDDEDAEEDPIDPDERDEQILLAARAERLNRQARVKVEPTESSDNSNSIQHLPRIPRLSTAKVERVCKSEFIEPLDNNVTVNEKPGPSGQRKRKKSTTNKFGFLSSGIRLEYNECDEGDEADSSESTASEYEPSREEVEDCNADGDSELDEDVDYEPDSEVDDNVPSSRRRTKLNKVEDDGDFRSYQARIKAYTKQRAQMRLNNINDDGTEIIKWDEMTTIEGDLRIPKEMWDNLFEHQKTGVRWLWELHQLGTGGILGDEMGLGKTIQMIAFLTALKNSDIRSAHNNYESLGPTVLVCPATVMHQWLLEFRKWYPQFRVAILHSTGTFSGDRKHLVSVIHKSKGILIVSYPGVVIYQDHLHGLDWHYAVLDEGHKIRNPDAQVTLACKRFRTPHRIILSGSPVQNNLKELWSIFDFIYPGKLGTLPVFMSQFGIPITQGGYANATDFQVQIAYKCACVLRDTIKPFLLRRTKAEVNNKLKLPDRSEQVLFCKLTERQRKMYQHYLDSPTVRDIKRGLCQIFVGLIQLRKICNHPDIFDSTECSDQIKQKEQEHMKKHLEFYSSDETYGHHKKSGKMMVVDALLKLWKKQNHKVLLFTQSRQMIKVFALYMDELKYKYLTMDGSTPIGSRQTMIDEFNKNDDIFIFLLTTRVGGVGINLTGANRIIIYDPDWNPSTDIQARERAWRIGQQRHVIIYRLLTAGTIEEKIYHRQVFKLYLTNRVLKDAKQKRFFKTNDMHELFTLGDNDKNIETKALFDEDLQINSNTIKEAKRLKRERKMRRKARKMERSEVIYGDQDGASVLSEQQREALRERAKRLSQMIAMRYGSSSKGDSTEDNQQVAIKQEHATAAASEESVPRSLSSPTLATANRIPENNGQKKSFSLRESNCKKRVDYLVKQDVYRPGVSEQGEKVDPRYKSDDYILERLFKSSNISGALKHDKIETDSTSDFKVVESEAEKVARDAIRALRESRRMCLSSSSGIPNWTGRNGHIRGSSDVTKARLVPKNRSAAQALKNSSSKAGESDSLLSSIKKRNQLNSVALARSTFGVPGRNDNDSEEEAEIDRDFAGKAHESGAEDMADKLRAFIIFKSARPGEAQTDELLEFFKSTFKPDMTPVFKALLYKMCEFMRRGDKGFWILKSEFRDT